MNPTLAHARAQFVVPTNSSTIVLAHVTQQTPIRTYMRVLYHVMLELLYE